MIHEYFTAKEIATALQELGFQAKIVEDDNCSAIESASSGKKWTAALYGVDPFFNSMLLRILIWVTKDPLDWANKWNSSNCSSMAHAVTLDDKSAPTPDDDGDYMIMISSNCEFEGGVTFRYLQNAFLQWMTAIEELSELDDIKMCPARSSNLS